MEPSAHADDPHLVDRVGWLRAAVMGANDGIVSVASLIVGVAAADPDPRAVLIAGAAGLAAGAMSMAAGEYVSVSSQADLEKADIERERQAILDDPAGEEVELAEIYMTRGLSEQTARQVARELMQKDPLAAHVRDELGLTEEQAAQPLLAAAASALTFSAFAAIPLIAAVLAPAAVLIPVVVMVTLVALCGLGALGAVAGGALIGPAALRVVVWGGLAMAVTAAVGRLFGVAV
ncbi:VIT1/CCC1 transporter family protein [Sulfitobacter guttiformis]|uniref:VIT1/CCC1 family predicted Fe2+/Mn2+ transporter n=1 Tax=Sulfitobacter guttiformis TaxID=74349 RepID=A0A420DT74_9RHOB|nr:VIT family protein [Sulfitobacter guttiformis]KIN74798.1 Integral membrane protein [Sulfitobacter guttiformis KCTC 32187]RKE97370.1 VIT1/CCC1 family predicted Fe2+/Mn2+ transporter [Sulfitobacter guttiformis]